MGNLQVIGGGYTAVYIGFMHPMDASRTWRPGRVW